MDLLKLARKKPVLADASMTVSEAIGRMVTNNVGAVVVTDSARHVLGIFTERDVLCRVAFKKLDAEKTLLRSVMTRPVQTATADTSIEEALSMMIVGKYRHLPVVDTLERVIAIVSLRYLLMRRLSEHRLLQRHLQDEFICQ